MSDENTTKRVTSKHTKRLFIAFGAASIAAVCVVYAPDAMRQPASPVRTTPNVQPMMIAPNGK